MASPATSLHLPPPKTPTFTPNPNPTQIVDDLVRKTGDGWEMALGKWSERAPTFWVIGASCALRLRAILTQCFETPATSQLYFAQTAPGGKGLKVCWPVGKKLLLLDMKRSASTRIGREKTPPSAAAPPATALTSHV